jgi:hypothetical protein
MDRVHPGLPAELMDRLIAELGAELARPPSEVRIERVEPVTWRDGSLGCPEPGMFYTQALVPGFRVILAVGERRFDYRIGRGGTFRRCAGASDEGGSQSDRRPGGADPTV